MQTFLPLPNYADSARALDNQRLGNQCYRECKTLLSGGWPNHPASKMWAGYGRELAIYGLMCALEMMDRNQAGTGCWKPEVPRRWAEYFKQMRDQLPMCTVPPWLGDDRVHSTHRSVLLWKKPRWYSQFGWKEKPLGPGEDGKFPYHWPK